LHGSASARLPAPVPVELPRFITDDGYRIDGVSPGVELLLRGADSSGAELELASPPTVAARSLRWP
jgi:hypothetical protein